jgi:hypothetical protein
MTKEEFEIIKRKNCKLTWLCIDCKPRLLKNQDTEGQKLDTLAGNMKRILDFIEHDLERKIREEIAGTLQKELMKVLSRPTVIKEQSPSQGPVTKTTPQQRPADSRKEKSKANG